MAPAFLINGRANQINNPTSVDRMCYRSCGYISPGLPPRFSLPTERGHGLSSSPIRRRRRGGGGGWSGKKGRSRRRKPARKNTRCLLEWQLEGLMIPPWPRRLVPVPRSTASEAGVCHLPIPRYSDASHRRDWTGLGSLVNRFINQRSFRFTPQQSTFRR